MTGGIDSNLPIVSQADSAASQDSVISVKSEAYGDSGTFGRVLDAQRSKSSERSTNGAKSTADDRTGGKGLPTDRTQSAAANEQAKNPSADTSALEQRQDPERGYTSAPSEDSEVETTVSRAAGDDLRPQSAALALASGSSKNAQAPASSAAQTQSELSIDAEVAKVEISARTGAQPGAQQSSAVSAAGNTPSGVANTALTASADKVLNSDGELRAQQSRSDELSNELLATRNTKAGAAPSAFTQREAIAGKERSLAGAELSSTAARSSLLEQDLRGVALKSFASQDTSNLLETNSSVSTRAVDAALATQSSLSGSTAANPLQTLGAGASNTAALSSSADPVPEFVLQQTATDGEFADEVAGRMQMLMRDGIKEARLQLNPAELGRLFVTISTDGDQARVAFLAESAGAREMIEQSLPKLREMLEQQGLQLAHSDVGEQGAFAEREASDSEQGTLASSEALDLVEVPLGADGAEDTDSQPRSVIDTYI